MSILWTSEDIIAATDGRPFGQMPDGVSGISIDSRTLRPREAFFAIKGDTFDGHDFASAAMAAGAFGVRQDAAEARDVVPAVVVDDEEPALRAQQVIGRRELSRVNALERRPA